MMMKKTMKPLLSAVGVTALSFGAMLGITAPTFADAGAPVAPVAPVAAAKTARPAFYIALVFPVAAATTASPAEVTPLHDLDQDSTDNPPFNVSATAGNATSGNGGTGGTASNNCSIGDSSISLPTGGPITITGSFNNSLTCSATDSNGGTGGAATGGNATNTLRVCLNSPQGGSRYPLC
jgi:hypothetical protein